MQTWKRKSAASYHSVRAASPSRSRRLSILFLLATVVCGLATFPAPWNASAAFVNAKTGWNVPMIPAAVFRLGLDLQGGTHLVYDADMGQIPAAQREDALSGVRDVIERRVNAFGVSEPLVQTSSTGGTYRLVVDLAGVLDVSQAIAQIGETPVLEFKEPGMELTRPLTDEEKNTLAERQTADRAAATAALERAQKGENFETLVVELSADANKVDDEASGTIGNKGIYANIVEGVGPNAPFIQAMKDTKSWVGRVIPKIVETSEGLNVVKYLGTTKSQDMRLSHILICYAGAAGCETEMPEIEASVLVNRLKDEATATTFADLAKQYSTDTLSAAQGGDLDWIHPGETVPTFEAAALNLKVGEISGVVQTAFGYHLVYKREIKPVTTYKFQRILLPLAKEADVSPAASPWKNTDLSGKHLKSAQVQFDQSSSQPFVAIAFDDEGGKLFAEMTARLVGQPIAIFLDGEPISTPVVQQAIYGGQAVINGDFTLEDSKLLAQRLNAGALPVPIKLLSQQTIGPTLGLASLQQSVEAALIGFTLVALFMIAVYRLPGVIAVLALVLYAFLNLLVYRLFGVTITLAGIAGFVLSVGMAVDANVLIIERIKEELAGGRDWPSAVRVGFTRAWSAIRDGNVVTLVSATILYAFSSSFVRGFALTLAVGVFVSLFTAIVVARAYMGFLFPEAASRHRWLSGFTRPS